MAENKTVKADDPADNSTQSVTKSDVIKAQAAYTGNEHSDLVEVTIIKDGTRYKKGDKDTIHPSVALILKAKGLIADEGKKAERPKFNQADKTVDV